MSVLMEKLECLLCGKEMEAQHKIRYIDYHCKQNNHHFACRITVSKVPVRDSVPWSESRIERKLNCLRLRLSSPDQDNLYLKIHYDLGYSEVWSKNSETKRIQINQIIVPDLTDIEKLKSRIKTILVFS